MSSLKLAEFFFSRIKETIDYKQYIGEVSIDFEHDETYGNDYIRVSYMVLVNERFESINSNEKLSLFQQAPTYSFSLSTNQGRSLKKDKMLRILEFRHIYESLASYAILQFETYLDAATAIKVRGIDMWPEANYVEKYLSSVLPTVNRRGAYFDLERNVSQWSGLHQLAAASRKIYTKEKEQFSITDIEINRLFSIELNSIHNLVLGYAIPIKVKGTQTIDEIRIHTSKLVAALKKEINAEYNYNLEKHKRLIPYLYNSFLMAEKIQIINYQQSAYLKHFIIQEGDILQLKDNRIVVVNTVSIDLENEINVEYAILKTDLQAGERTRVIGTRDILFVLKKSFFQEFIAQTLVKHLSILYKWMLKRKMKFSFMPFTPDLTKDMDVSDKK
ncbi:hypothetical protein GFS24_09785 [Chitinophaga sp. SYP-B3965]|uniref:hypothetical protein n=1 Tax=Chitinophaga sp. SYP-B3965 TaxID=2663120 RepID=UPI001299A7D4|nr:hypothetical protein [Chitinophaga sp. SYP-B3965]MRG45406.1 hypothetical protein [Chitinophaga sp. SYP-B3965]